MTIRWRSRARWSWLQPNRAVTRGTLPGKGSEAIQNERLSGSGVDHLSQMTPIGEESVMVLNANQPVGTALGTNCFDKQIVDVAFAVGDIG